YTWNPDSFIPANLIINKAPQQIDFTLFEEVQLNAGQMPLTASSNSDLPVVLEVDDATVANLSGTDLVLLKAGTVTITARQGGNSNYEAAMPVSATIRVIAPVYSALIKVHTGVSPNGDGINDFLKIDDIEKYPDNQLTLFDRSGNIIQEIEGYDNSQQVF